MGLPWKRDEDLNIASNEYTTKLSINRCFNRLLGNDIYLSNNIDAGIDRATGLRFASRQEVKDLDTILGGISPADVLALSATDSETLTGMAVVDRFLTPVTLTQVFIENELLPKVTFIDITYRGNISSLKQIFVLTVEEIGQFDPAAGPIITVWVIWPNVSDVLGIAGENLLLSKVGEISRDLIFNSALIGNEDRYFTFQATGIPNEWTYLRQRESIELISRTQSSGRSGRWF